MTKRLKKGTVDYTVLRKVLAETFNAPVMSACESFKGEISLCDCIAAVTGWDRWDYNLGANPAQWIQIEASRHLDFPCKQITVTDGDNDEGLDYVIDVSAGYEALKGVA
jgi:hypothetical protein